MENDRSDAKKIVANIGWLSLDKLLHALVGLLVGVWITRYLGPEQFGLLSYTQAFVALFSVLATLGMDVIVVRNIVRNPDMAGETLGTAFIMRLAAGLLTFCLTMLVIYIMYPHDLLIKLLVGIIAAGSVFQAFDTIDLWFQARVCSKYTVYAKNAAFLAVSLLKVVLIIKEASLVAFALAGLAEVVIGSVGMVIVYRASGQSLANWRGSLARGKDLFRDSWPLIFSSLVIMIYMRIDQIMLREMLGDNSVGVYSAAVRLAEVWYFIPMAVVPSVFPSIVEARKVSDELFHQRLQKLYRLMALLGYGVAIPGTILANWVVGFLYGSDFSESGPILAILLWAGLFTNLGVARTSYLTTLNWPKVHFMTTSAGCVINIVANLILIPRYGGAGAAVATLLSYWFAAHGSCFFYSPLFKTGNMLTKALIMPVPGRM